MVGDTRDWFDLAGDRLAIERVYAARWFTRTCLVFGEGAVHVVFPPMTEHGAGFLAEFQFLGGRHANCALEQTEEGEEDERDAPT